MTKSAQIEKYLRGMIILEGPVMVIQKCKNYIAIQKLQFL